jgi:hypothetical protein
MTVLPCAYAGPAARLEFAEAVVSPDNTSAENGRGLNREASAARNLPT